MSEVRVMVAGGGTAGHIEPALAVADALRDRGAYVCALGSPKGLEKDIVPARGYDLDLIPPVPVPRKLNMALLRLPKGVWQAVSQAKKIMRAARGCCDWFRRLCVGARLPCRAPVGAAVFCA